MIHTENIFEKENPFGGEVTEKRMIRKPQTLLTIADISKGKFRKLFNRHLKAYQHFN